MNKKIKILALFLVYACYSYGQQYPLFSLYMFDKNIYNPGYCGITNRRLELALDVRKQYLGSDYGPLSTNMSGHSGIGYSRWAVGGRFMSDGILFYSQQGLWVNGAYKLPLKAIESELSIGAELGYILKIIDYSQIQISQVNDPTFKVNNSSAGTYSMPDLGLGILFKRKDWYLGGSIKSLFPSRFGSFSFDRNNPARLYRHYFINGGGMLKLVGKFVVQPSFLLRLSEYGYNQSDLSLSFSYSNIFGIGATFRTLGVNYNANNYIIVPFISLKVLNGMYFHYSYDYSAGALNNVFGGQSGSHEIMLRYMVDTRPVKVRIVDPRYSY